MWCSPAPDSCSRQERGVRPNTHAQGCASDCHSLWFSQLVARGSLNPPPDAHAHKVFFTLGVPSVSPPSHTHSPLIQRLLLWDNLQTIREFCCVVCVQSFGGKENTDWNRLRKRKSLFAPYSPPTPLRRRTLWLCFSYNNPGRIFARHRCPGISLQRRVKKKKKKKRKKMPSLCCILNTCSGFDNRNQFLQPIWRILLKASLLKIL